MRVGQQFQSNGFGFRAVRMSNGDLGAVRCDCSKREVCAFCIEVIHMYREKRAKSQKAARKASQAPDAFAERIPAIVEYLRSGSGKDGESKGNCSFTLFWDDMSYKACCTDKEAGEMCFWSGTTLEELLEAMEGDLKVGGGSWRKDRKRRS